MSSAKPLYHSPILILRASMPEEDGLAFSLRDFGMARVETIISLADLEAMAAKAPLGAVIVIDADLPSGMRRDAYGLPIAPIRTSPCLLLIARPTRGVMRAARASGFAAVLAEEVAPRVVYRRLGGLLQRHRRDMKDEFAHDDLVGR